MLLLFVPVSVDRFSLLVLGDLTKLLRKLSVAATISIFCEYVEFHDVAACDVIGSLPSLWWWRGARSNGGTDQFSLEGEDS